MEWGRLTPAAPTLNEAETIFLRCGRRGEPFVMAGARFALLSPHGTARFLAAVAPEGLYA